MSAWNIYSVLAMGAAGCFIVLRPKGDTSDVGIAAGLASWDPASGFAATFVDSGIVGAAALRGPSRAVVCCTAMGEAFIVRGEEMLADEAAQDQDGFVDSSPEGPNGNGFISGMRALGNSVIAFGMGRQVYRRDPGQRWTRMDHGVLDTSIEASGITGFRAIDGVDADNLLAVGFGGEMWRYRARQWEQLDSPTNLLLRSVCSLGPEKYLAGGNRGTLLRVVNDTIEVVPETGLNDNLNQLVTFRDSIFVATDAGILRCADRDGLDAWEAACPGSDLYYGIACNESSIWLYGSDRIVSSTDAVTWSELDLAPLWDLIA
jgi:hypothetical protein